MYSPSSPARAGLTSPDIFHLGHLAQLGSGRFCARLDSLHPVEIPTDAADVARFLADKRVATLHIDFARAQHVRLFNAFASMGFDDYSWPSDTDLQWLVLQGKKVISAQEATVLQVQADQAGKSAEGKQLGAGDERALAAARRRLEELKDKVRPYEDELAKRKAMGSLPVTTDPGV
jgi:hypothetical protein